MQVYSFLLDQASPQLIPVEYHSRFQIPSFHILGLPAPEIQEARERIIAAFINAGFEFPKKKIIVNLNPASIRKSGTGHDFAIAIAILQEELGFDPDTEICAWGELGLDGSLKSPGKVASLMNLLLRPNTRPIKKRYVFLADKDYLQFQSLIAWRKKNGLACPDSFQVFSFIDLSQLRDFSEDHHRNPEWKEKEIEARDEKLASLLPLSPIQKRVLEISLTGGHHVLLLGSKGSGKSASLEWFKILRNESDPLQTWNQILYQETRQLPLNFTAPIRLVHSQIRPSHLLGTFTAAGYHAGELALAHGGLLIADEFLEWNRDSKECLREPLQSERFTVSRVKGSFEAKCETQVIASGNLCPCGGTPPAFRISSQKSAHCRCKPIEVEKYLKRISGPILDRIDLVAVTPSGVIAQQTFQDQTLEVQRIREQIQKARLFAIEKFGAIPSQLRPDWLENHLPTSDLALHLLNSLSSLRSRHKLLRIARTIQALDASEELKDEHLFESKAFRIMDTVLE